MQFAQGFEQNVYARDVPWPMSTTFIRDARLPVKEGTGTLVIIISQAQILGNLHNSIHMKMQMLLKHVFIINHLYEQSRHGINLSS